jgi:hypothetical protein
MASKMPAVRFLRGIDENGEKRLYDKIVRGELHREGDNLSLAIGSDQGFGWRHGSPPRLVATLSKARAPNQELTQNIIRST